MGRLLDSDAVKKALYDAVDDISRGYTAVDGIEEDDIEGIIDSVPSVQFERKTGHWVDTSPNYKNGFYNNAYYCSECKNYYTTSPSEMHYCPNCGAKMEGETE